MKRFIPIYIIIALLAAACNREPEVVPTPVTSNDINFDVENIVDDSRAELITGPSSEAFRAKSFRVFAEHTPEGGAPQDVFNDVYVSYDGILTGWNYPAPYREWADDGDYVFRAFWPSTTMVEGTATTSSLVLQYSTAVNNDDMMVAYYACPTRNPDNYDRPRYVVLRFFHTLSAVRVAFKIGEHAQADYKVKEVYFTSVYRIGSLQYTQTNNTAIDLNYWTGMLRAENDEFSTDKVRRWVDGDEGVSGDVPKTTDDSKPQYLYLPWQFMIPQSLEVDYGELKPGVHVVVEAKLGGSTVTEDKELTLPLPAGLDKWEPGKRYTYTISLQPNMFDISVQTTPWDEVDAVVPDIIF